jgi:hypothetical protein
MAPRNDDSARMRNALAAIIAGGLFAATPASADLLMNFQEDPDDATPVPFYIAFGVNTTAGDTFTATGTVNGVAGTEINPNQSYLYESGPNCSGADTLCGAVDITKATPNARVLVSLGNGLTIANDGSANFANPDPGNAAQLLDFQTRWDKFEFDYDNTLPSNNPQGGANLSSTDFFGLPMQLTTTQASHPSHTLTWNYSSTVNTATVFSTLGAQAGYSLDQAPNDGVHNLGAIVANGANGVTVAKPDGSQIRGVVRVIAPTTTNGGQTPYPNFSRYLTHLETGGAGSTPIDADIAGNNGRWGAGNTLQTYDLTASIANVADPAETVNGVEVQAGDLYFVGTVVDETGSHELKILIQASQLTTYAIYGANITPAEVEGPDGHNVVQHAVADYIAGLLLGFIGSPELYPGSTDTIGESPSWMWYGNGIDGEDTAALLTKYAYGSAQPGTCAADSTGVTSCYYDMYADALNGDSSGTTVTDSYGFPYIDRVKQPLANLYSDTTLTLTILPDEQGLGVSAPIPEPSTWAMMGLGFAGLAFMGYRARRKSAATAA